MLGFTQNYIIPYALALKASVTQIGLLSSIPNAVMASTQLFSPFLSEKAGSRKSFIVPLAFVHGLTWIPVLLTVYIFPTQQVWWLIFFITLGTIFDSMSATPWSSMMADLVPEEVRGRYFSSRSRIAGFVAMIFSFIAGGILQAFTKNVFTGFSIILGGAFVSRCFSVYFLAQMDEPQAAITTKNNQQSIFKLSSILGSTNTGKFILYSALINFAANIAGPFFSVYMLRDLKMNYLTYVIIASTATLVTLLCLPYWGKRVDRFGNIKVLKFTSWLIPLIPIMWLVSANVYYLCFAQVISGFAWAGFNLAVGLFIYDATPAENRTRYIALHYAMMYGGISLGSLLGGIITPHLPVLKQSNLITIFLISGLARLVIVLIFLPRISEVRPVPKINTKEFLFSSTDLTELKNFGKHWRNRRQ